MMGRYDGEDFSDQHYVEQAKNRAERERSTTMEFALSFAPPRWRYIARLSGVDDMDLDNDYAPGQFDWDKARAALGRVRGKDELLKEWIKAGLLKRSYKCAWKLGDRRGALEKKPSLLVVTALGKLVIAGYGDESK